MQFQYTPYILPLLFAGIISAAIAFYVWQLRARRAAIALTVLAAAAAIWSLGYVLEIAGADLPTKEFWGKLQYFGITAVPLGWLAFALQYSGHDRALTRRNMALLAVVPLLTLGLALTNDVHHLIWQKTELDTSGAFLALAITHGFGFWVYWLYSQLLVLAGTIRIVRTLLGAQRPYRRQAVVLLVAAFAPWIGNALYISGLNPVPLLDLTPFAFALSAAAMALGVFQLRFLYLAPVARETVVEHMSDGVIVLDAQGYVADLNPAAQRLIGSSASQAVGQSAAEVFKAWPKLVEQYRDIAEARDEIAFGEGAGQRHYELRLSALKQQAGRTVERIITIRDITERKQAEEALARQTARLTTLYQLSKDIVSTLDAEQAYTAAHQAVAQLMPLEAFFIALLEEEQQAVQDVYLFDRGRRWPNERDPLAARGMTASVIRTGEPLRIDDDAAGVSQALGRLPFGEADTPRSILVVPLKLAGRSIGVMSAQHYAPHIYSADDVQILVTLANQVAIAIENARLVQSLRLQAAALNATANAIVITDREGVIQWVNPAFTTLTGYAASEAVGGTPRLLKSGEYGAAFYRQLWDTITAGQIWQGEISNRRKDGSLYVEMQTITPIHDELGKIFRFISVKQDITELIVARDEALEASRLKSQLLARVSHELRTPLGAILGYAELLQDGSFGPLAERQKQAVAEIMDSTRDLTELVNELLDEAQLEARAVKLQIGPFAPAEMLGKVAAAMDVVAHTKGLAFIPALAPDLPKVLYGDEARLRQVLINLIGNAIKFTDKGSVGVRLYCYDAASWAMEVSDTGPGIPEEAQPYIFEAFRQVDGSMTREYRGTGLGLSIVEHFTQLMNGEIKLKSELGRGSTFTIVLPFAAAQEAP